MTELAPIVLFAFRRPKHVGRTLESLAANDLAVRSRLIVYADGPRSAFDVEAVEATRKILRAARGFADIEIVERPANVGLARNVIEGVTKVCERFGRAIVLEDDLVFSAHFLAYMNEALILYEKDERVASIHGYCYEVRTPLPETFFLRGADCWGWATWSRAWSRFRTEGQALLSELEARRLTREFDLDDSYPFTQMLRDQIVGRNDSWAIRWHASCFLDNTLTLYPGRSLVHNIGNDSSGTHSGTTARFDQVTSQTPIHVERLPLSESTAGRTAFVKFFRTQRAAPMRRVAGLLRRLWKRPS